MVKHKDDQECENEHIEYVESCFSLASLSYRSRFVGSLKMKSLMHFALRPHHSSVDMVNPLGRSTLDTQASRPSLVGPGSKDSKLLTMLDGDRCTARRCRLQYHLSNKGALLGGSPIIVSTEQVYSEGEQNVVRSEARLT